MYKNLETIKVIYKEASDISTEEAGLRVNKAFDVLFEATLDNIKNEDIIEK